MVACRTPCTSCGYHRKRRIDEQRRAIFAAEREWPANAGAALRRNLHVLDALAEVA